MRIAKADSIYSVPRTLAAVIHGVMRLTMIVTAPATLIANTVAGFRVRAL